MKTTILNGKTNREYLIWKLLRDWPALRYGRKLTRYSTKQLLAKEQQMQKMVEKQRHSYVQWLDSVQRAA